MKILRILHFVVFGLFITCHQQPLAAQTAKLCGPHSDISNPGYPAGRADADVDGDGCLDYCRVVGNNPSDAAIWCTVSYGPLKGQTIKSPNHPFDWGYEQGRAWIDINQDNKADYCRVGGNSNHVDSVILCSISLGDRFEPTIQSNVIDWGYPYHRKFRDCNNDGSIDYCRAVGNTGNTFIRCNRITYSDQSLNIPSDDTCKYPDPDIAALPAQCVCNIGFTDKKIEGGACGKQDCTLKCTSAYPPNSPNPTQSSRCYGGTKNCSTGCAPYTAH